MIIKKKKKKKKNKKKKKKKKKKDEDFKWFPKLKIFNRDDNDNIIYNIIIYIFFKKKLKVHKIKKKKEVF